MQRLKGSIGVRTLFEVFLGISTIVSVNLRAELPSTIPRAGFAEPDGIVYAMALSQGILYLGGAFGHVNGTARTGLAALNASSGELLDWNPNVATWPDKEVRCLAVAENTVYFGGSFNNVNGQQRLLAAAVDMYSGRLTEWNPLATGTSSDNFLNPIPIVNALAVAGDRVFVGGWFTNIGGADHTNFAILDREQGASVADGTDAPGVVFAIAVNNGLVYYGGSTCCPWVGYVNYRGIDHDQQGSLDVSLPYPQDPSMYITSLTISKNRLYAGGWTRQGRAGNIPNRGVAFGFDLSNHSRIWQADIGGLAVTPVVYGMTVAAETVFVGGSFSPFWTLDATTGQANSWRVEILRDSAPFAPAPPNVRAVVTDGASVYVAGAFQQVSDRPRRNLAVFSPKGFSALSISSMAPTPSMQLRLNGNFGENYRIESSVNLTDWFPLVEHTMDDAPFLHEDSSGGVNQIRFYRAISLP